MARVTGMDEVRAALEDGVKRALTAAGMVAVEATQEQMMSGYGAPIWDTGATIQSLTYEVQDASVHFGVGTEYAPFVHDGTYKMISRPFIADVINDPDFQQGVQDVMQEQLSDALK